MSDVNWANLLSTFSPTDLLGLGPLVLASALFLGALGLPIPGTVLVLATGALAQQGLVNGVQAFALGLAGVVLGDSLSYGLGRVAGPTVTARLARTRAWQEAALAFDRRHAWLVYLTRWLFTPLAIPVNLMAGSRGLSFWRFLGHDAAGELTWLALYGGLGFAVGSQWTVVAEQIATLGDWLLVLVVLVIGLALLARMLVNRQPAGRPVRTLVHAGAAHLARRLDVVNPTRQLTRLWLGFTAPGKHHGVLLRTAGKKM